MNAEEVKGFIDDICCGICFDIVFEKKDPVELDCCGVVIFCRSCITEALKIKN
jgi:hypothetical protein